MIDNFIWAENKAELPVLKPFQPLEGVQAGCAKSTQKMRNSNAAAMARFEAALARFDAMLARFDAALAKHDEISEKYREWNAELRQR